MSSRRGKRFVKDLSNPRRRETVFNNMEYSEKVNLAIRQHFAAAGIVLVALLAINLVNAPCPAQNT
jgi:hypothetical protein